MFDWIEEAVGGALQGNEFFAGGFVLMLITSAVVLLRRIPGLIVTAVEHQMSVQVEIRDYNLIKWMDVWVQSQPYSRVCRRLKAIVYHDPQSEDGVPQVFLVPGIGRHLVRHEGTTFLIHRAREQKGDAGGNAEPFSWGSLLDNESLTIRCFGKDSAPAHRLLEAARDAAHQHLTDRKEMLVHVNRWGHDWHSFTVGRTRSLDSVILPRGVVAGIVEDIEKFLSPERREWYFRRGIPYRRGYLFHGPPGSGKSSMVRALASDLGLKLYIMDLTRESLSDLDVAQLLAETPPKSLMLVEDVDCFRVSRDREVVREEAPRGERDSKVTLSGFLNALDGSVAGEGRVLVMTTNYPARLDAALTRPGRVDYSVSFEAPIPEQAEELFLRFFESETDLAARFGELGPKVPGSSMALLQGVLVKNHENPLDALSAVSDPSRVDDIYQRSGRNGPGPSGAAETSILGGSSNQGSTS